MASTSVRACMVRFILFRLSSRRAFSADEEIESLAIAILVSARTSSAFYLMFTKLTRGVSDALRIMISYRLRGEARRIDSEEVKHARFAAHGYHHP